MSILVDGNIPAHTVCPWKNQCYYSPNLCYHQGKEHTISFSCASARAFDITNTQIDDELIKGDK